PDTGSLLVARATGLTRTSIVATLALDRIFDPICFGLLLLAATFVIPLPVQLSRAQPIAAVALIIVIGLLVFLVRAPAPVSDVAKVTIGWRALLRAFRHQVAFLSTFRRFVMATLVSAGVWGLQ